jgi:hypothetical protein
VGRRIYGGPRIVTGQWFPPPLIEHDVRFWHKADMLNALMNVRFWGQSVQ